ncbi:YjgP/YjgQ family permease [Corallococcus praedator]|uniref:YjgP/YjgQ family permease n=1 Tax=Corallococcus praedator TaxID=2316724 RepID=A0ABX9Q9T0_9BACT|nr:MULTISPECIES: LptF/LptG family permease [Corallococcus]RKH08056.1 YjgP/YjgQ family permease [Corallococcus sp. CA047B]RKH26053.1 YjgP/YjgQ family permease [Corallococcus sp. CA031C]RKH97311.1 YjgP/YjgQ family permease [Corallococcus praedator]
MKLLARYLLKELLVPLGVWVAFMFLLLFVMQFLRGTDVLLGSAVTLSDLGRLIAYLAPHFLVMALPIAFLLAILLGLGRLGEDRELTSLQALGISPLQLLAAPLGVGLALSAFMVLLTSTVEPWGLTGVKELVGEVIQKNVAGDVKSGVFYEDLSDLTLYAQKVAPNGGGWTNVLLHDDRDPSSPLLVLAHRGRVGTSERGEALTIELQEGEVHRANRSSVDASVVSFEKAQINVGLGGSLSRRNRFRSPKEELTPVELLAAAKDAEERKDDPRPFLMALHSRLGNAVAPVAFALLATPLAIGRKQAGRAWGYLLTLGGYVLYYLLSRAFEQMGQKGQLPVLVAGQLANVLFMVVGAVALYRVTRSGTVR